LPVENPARRQIISEIRAEARPMSTALSGPPRRLFPVGQVPQPKNLILMR